MAAVTGAVIAGAAVANSAYQGKKARDAARDAAQMQSDAALQSANATERANERLRVDLSPYREAGQTSLPLLQQRILNPQESVNRLESNPLFKASLAARDRETLGAAANQGRIGTGDFSQQIAENYLLAASPLLQQEEQSLLNLASIGQASAAQTGIAGLNAAQASGADMMSAANARSAGIVASQQATANQNAQILQNMPALISSISAARGNAAGGTTNG